MSLIQRFWSDESGFLISAELVLVATICVFGAVVGLAEVSVALTGELNDLGGAIGSLNQSFSFVGFTATSQTGTPKAIVAGSFFIDFIDICDNNQLGEMLVSPTAGEASH